MNIFQSIAFYDTSNYKNLKLAKTIGLKFQHGFEFSKETNVPDIKTMTVVSLPSQENLVDILKFCRSTPAFIAQPNRHALLIILDDSNSVPGILYSTLSLA
jgi:hypothetical protein